MICALPFVRTTFSRKSQLIRLLLTWIWQDWLTNPVNVSEGADGFEKFKFNTGTSVKLYTVPNPALVLPPIKAVP